MALGKDTFSSISGAVSDLFASQGARENAALQAQGLRITAAGTMQTAVGTRITAQGTLAQAEGQDISAKATRLGEEETRISAAGLRYKAQGDLAEAENYALAAALARKNIDYTRESQGIQQMQLDRQIAGSLGKTRAGYGGAGLRLGGSALDVLADSASQGRLAKSVLARQGEITEAGFEEQAQSYDTMSAAARMAYAGQLDIAARTEGLTTRQEEIAVGQEGIATRIRSIAASQEKLALSQEAIAAQQTSLATQTEKAGEDQAGNTLISGMLKGVTAVASVFL